MQTNKRRTTALRWLARMFSILCGAFFLFFVFGQAWGKTDPRPIAPFFLLALAMIGGLIAWREERIGGTVAIIAAVALGLYMYDSNPAHSLQGALYYSLPFLIPGILIIICSQQPIAKNAT